MDLDGLTAPETVIDSATTGIPSWSVVSYYEDTRAAFRRGETAVVERLSREELARARGSADVDAEVEALCMLARISGDLASARTLYAESIALSEEFGNADRVVMEMHNLAYVEWHAGDVDRARELFTTTCRPALEQGIDDFLPYVTLDAAIVAEIDGDHVHAARLLAAAESALAALGQILDPDDAIEQKELRGRLVTALGPDGFDAAYATGAGLGLREALGG
ncbi:tetratricopeptide repeat protein [Pseudonocardia xinjiangensis]|uniref:tetratricopeptide repeat protein n=1 Tax=Pseudonocardia xinjiangensis TaxID=75289 RepID=UPI003D8AF63A